LGEVARSARGWKYGMKDHSEQGPSHDRRFHGDAGRLRAPARIALLETPRVIALCTGGAAIATVLDVGTGTGVFAEAFLSAGLEVTGIDPVVELLELARAYVPQALFAAGTAEKLPFPDQSFDLVFLGHVLHETDDPQAALGEACRTAKKRIAVLEWPYRREENGPPLAHRISPERILALAAVLGFSSLKRTDLSHMDLYVWDR